MALNTLPNGLRDVNRFITTHNEAGESVYSDSLPPNAKWQEIGGVVNFFLGYTTHKFPASLDPKAGEDTKSTPEDIENYSKELASPGDLSHSTGKLLPHLKKKWFNGTRDGMQICGLWAGYRTHASDYFS